MVVASAGAQQLASAEQHDPQPALSSVAAAAYRSRIAFWTSLMAATLPQPIDVCEWIC
jgi:hypothetical protein